LTSSGQIELVGIFEMSLGFEGGELKELVDEFFAAFGLRADIVDEAGPVGLRHVFIEKFGSSLNGGERRFEFVGEGLNVAFGVLSSLQGFPHVVESVGEGADFAAQSDLRPGTPFPPCDGAGVVGEFSDRSEEPNEDSNDEGKNPQADEND